MPTQPNEQNWSGAVQRELDGLQRSVDTRFADFSTRLDKLLTLTEYYADKRAVDIRFENLTEKVHDAETDLYALKTETREAYNSLRVEVLAAISREREERKTAIKEFIESKKSQFRWLVSMVMIPVAVAIVDLIVSKK